MKKIPEIKLISRMAILILLLFSGSCKKDEDSVPASQGTVITNVVGKVTHWFGNPISGVTVRSGTNVTTTDKNGIYVFSSIAVPNDFITLSFAKSGLTDQCIRKVTQPNGVNYVNTSLMMNHTDINFSSTAGATMPLSFNSQNSQINIPANAFTDANGNPYNGTVWFGSEVWDFDNFGNENTVPGVNSEAINANGEKTFIYKYGTMRLMAYSSPHSGLLKLAPGKKIDIYYYKQWQNFPTDMKCWKLDMSSGIWMEAATASWGGNSIAFSIAELGSWNVAFEAPAAIVEGRVVDCNGTPLPGITVTIKYNFNITTDNTGTYRFKVMQSPGNFDAFIDADLNPQFQASGSVVQLNATSSFNTANDIVMPCVAIQKGTIKSCDGSEKIPGLAFCSWNGNSYFSYALAGDFVTFSPPQTELNIEAKAYGYSNNIHHTSGNSGSITNAGPALICAGSSPNDQISFTVFKKNSFVNYELTPSVATATQVDTTGDFVFDKTVINIQGTVYPGNLPAVIAISLADMTTADTYSLIDPAFNANAISIQVGSETFLATYNFNTLLTDNIFVITDPGTPGTNLKGRFEYDCESLLPFGAYIKFGKLYALRTN